MSREPHPQDDPFARMANALREEPSASRAPRRRSQPSFADGGLGGLAPVIQPGKAPPVKAATKKKKTRVARSEPLPSIAIAGETRPLQATESGPALPSVMVSRPIASPTVRRQVAAPTMRRASGPIFTTMTTRKKSAVLLFLAFSLSVFALGVALFFFSRTPAAPVPASRVNAAEQPPPSNVDARLSANLLAQPPQR